MRLGIFGGSFDPIHRGHLDPVESVRRALRLDRVVYLPTAQPPHKPERGFAPPHARFAMVELALLDRPELRVSAFELTPGRSAYTVDTVAHFRQRYPEASLFLILGADSWLHFSAWKEWQRILEMAQLAVMVRPGWQLESFSTEIPARLQEAIEAERVHLVENPPLAISSSEVRRLLAEEPMAVASMLPDLVLRYINKYALYS